MSGPDKLNADQRATESLVYLNGDLVLRADARVSVFDAGFLAGDGVWEGLRLHNGKVLFAERHIERLYAAARAVDLDIGLARGDLIGAVELTCTANKLTDGAYIRLVVSRGAGRGGRATVVIAAEQRPADAAQPPAGLKLFTSTVRCSPADMLDMRLKTLSRLHLTTAQIQARRAGAEEALLLDPRGFVSTAGAANFFMVKAGAVYTSTGAYCFNGITRASVIALCDANRIPLFETDFTLAEAYVADEAFLTGTFGGIVPVRDLDGRGFGKTPGPLTARLRKTFDTLKDRLARG